MTEEIEEFEAFFQAMNTPAAKRTLTIRSESGEFIGYCEAPDIEEIYAAQRAKAGEHLKKLGRAYTYYKHQYFETIKWAAIGSHHISQAANNMVNSHAAILTAIAAFRAVGVFRSPKP